VGPVPNWLNWTATIAGLLGVAIWIVQKAPVVRRYFASRERRSTETTRSRREYLVGGLLATTCAIIWSVSYVSLSAVARNTSVISMNVILMGSGALFLYAGSAIARIVESRKNLPKDAGVWRVTVAPLLVFANLGNFVLSTLALHYITASQANALNNMSPALLALGLLVLGRFRPSLATAITFAFLIFGVWFANSDAAFSLRLGPQLTGSSIAIAAGASFAVWAYVIDVAEDKIKRVSSRMEMLALVFLGSYAILLTAAWLTGSEVPRGRFEVILLTLNGLRVGVVYYLFQLAVRKAGPLLPSVVVVIQIPMTMFVDHVWLGTEIGRNLMIGGAIIVLSVIGLLTDELQRANPDIAGERTGA
jgi:drug/metabolite transporter (DMT)-like permease